MLVESFGESSMKVDLSFGKRGGISDLKKEAFSKTSTPTLSKSRDMKKSDGNLKVGGSGLLLSSTQHVGGHHVSSSVEDFQVVAKEPHGAKKPS